jgi:hypothetical protein
MSIGVIAPLGFAVRSGTGDSVLAGAAVAVGIAGIGAIVGSAASAGDTSDVLRGATMRTAARRDERADKGELTARRAYYGSWYAVPETCCPLATPGGHC